METGKSKATPAKEKFPADRMNYGKKGDRDLVGVLPFGTNGIS